MPGDLHENAHTHTHTHKNRKTDLCDSERDVAHIESSGLSTHGIAGERNAGAGGQCGR